MEECGERLPESVLKQVMMLLHKPRTQNHRSYQNYEEMLS
jgi:hypothetical protein